MVESKRALVMENVRTVLPFLKEGLDEGPSRAIYPSEDTGPPEEGDELLFISDEEGPNAAWVWSHHRRLPGMCTRDVGLATTELVGFAKG
jgi:hypothetical protein